MRQPRRASLYVLMYPIMVCLSAWLSCRMSDPRNEQQVYFFLMVFYLPYTIYSYGFKAWGKMLLVDGWKCTSSKSAPCYKQPVHMLILDDAPRADLILAAIDVEANFTVVKAYQYTDILSAALLNGWATPACMIVAYVLVRARYHWSQILGVLVCIGGLALLVVSDMLGHGSTTGSNKPKGWSASVTFFQSAQC